MYCYHLRFLIVRYHQNDQRSHNERKNMAKEADKQKVNSVESSYPLMIAIDYEGGEVSRLICTTVFAITS